MVVDRQKVKTRSESRRYKVADRLEVKANRLVRQAEWSGRREQSPETGKGQNQED